MPKLSDRLRSLRNSRGLSQQKLADLLGVSKSSINMYERDERVPRDEVKVRIASYFKTSVQDIFFTD